MFRYNVCVFGLLTLIFGSSYTIILLKYYGREEVTQAQILREQHDALKTEWYSLQEERSRLTTHDNIQSIAEQERGMRTPTREQTRMVIVNEAGT